VAGAAKKSGGSDTKMAKPFSRDNQALPQKPINAIKLIYITLSLAELMSGGYSLYIRHWR